MPPLIDRGRKEHAVMKILITIADTWIPSPDARLPAFLMALLAAATLTAPVSAHGFSSAIKGIIWSTPALVADSVPLPPKPNATTENSPLHRDPRVYTSPVIISEDTLRGEYSHGTMGIPVARTPARRRGRLHNQLGVLS
jgi:hypothetical protein